MESDVKPDTTDKRSSRELSRRTSFDPAESSRMVRLETENNEYRGRVERLETDNNEYRGQVDTLTRKVEQLEEQLRKAAEGDSNAVHLKPGPSTSRRSLSRRRPFSREIDENEEGGAIHEGELIKKLKEIMKHDRENLIEELTQSVAESVSDKTLEKVGQVLDRARQPRDPEEGAVARAVGDVRKRTMWQYVRAANRWNDTTGNTIYSFASMVITFAGFYYLFHSPQSSSAPPMP